MSGSSRGGGDAATADLAETVESLAARLRAAGRVGRTVQIKVRFADFRTITRSPKSKRLIRGAY